MPDVENLSPFQATRQEALAMLRALATEALEDTSLSRKFGGRRPSILRQAIRELDTLEGAAPSLPSPASTRGNYILLGSTAEELTGSELSSTDTLTVRVSMEQGLRIGLRFLNTYAGVLRHPVLGGRDDNEFEIMVSGKLTRID